MEVGSIELGVKADLIVLDRNSWKVAPTAIQGTKVKMTFIDGELIYDAANPPKLSAR